MDEQVSSNSVKWTALMMHIWQAVVLFLHQLHYIQSSMSQKKQQIADLNFLLCIKVSISKS